MRVELLYPFPREQIVELIACYPNLEEIIWVQEEPKNMGARRFVFTRAASASWCPRACRSATSAASTGPARARATRQRTTSSRTASCARRYGQCRLRRN